MALDESEAKKQGNKLVKFVAESEDDFTTNDASETQLLDKNVSEEISFQPIREKDRRKSAMETFFPPQRKVSQINFSDQTRFVVLLLSTLCLAITISNTMALNFTIICMASSTGLEANSTAANSTVYDYTQTQRGLLFSAVAIGAILGTQPVVWMTSRFGGRLTFTLFGMLSAISTLLCPLAASISFQMLFVMRILQGFAVAFSYPSVGSISAQWTTMQQSGMFISLMSCYLQIGPIFTMPVAGALCVSSFGWPAVYYLQGTLTLIIFLVFYAFYRDSPRFHRNVSDRELTRIEGGRIADASLHSKKRSTQPVPYLAVCKNLPIIGVWISCIGGNLGFHIFVQYGPIYLNKVLGYDVENTGFSSALPFFVSMVMKIIAGPLSDHLTFISERVRVMIFAGVSQGVMAICILALAILPPSALFGQIFYTAAVGFSGLNVVGVVRCSQLVARQHVHFVMAVMSLIGWSIVLVLPVFVTLIAPDNSPSQWALMFYVISGIVIATNVFFMFVADSEPAEWTREPPEKKPSNIHYIGDNELEKR